MTSSSGKPPLTIVSTMSTTFCSSPLALRYHNDVALHYDSLPEVPTAKPFYSIEEIVALLSLHRATVSGFISRGELRAARLGHRTVRVTHEALLDFLKSKESIPVPREGSAWWVKELTARAQSTSARTVAGQQA